MVKQPNNWNKIFSQEGKVFVEPQEDLPQIVKTLKQRKAKAVLDLGCGTGRHVVYLAGCGFSVYGLDNSPQALKIAGKWLVEENLTADLKLRTMTRKFPYQSEFFDAVLSFQVIHHANIATIRRIVGEIARVLKHNGFLFATVPSQKNQATAYSQLEPNTFIPLDGPEKGLPHHFFTPQELRQVFKGFIITDIHLDTWEHYCMSAYKR